MNRGADLSVGPDPQAGSSGTYGRIAELLKADQCVVLDGGVGTELPRVADEPLWGTRALVDDPEGVRAVHCRYVETGCDVISTNTWGLPAAITGKGPRLWHETDTPVHWMDIARVAVGLARDAIAAGDRTGSCAVAFSLNADIDSPEGREAVPLLTRLFAEGETPDLVLVETLSVVRPSLFDTVARLTEIGLPVWLSFRRCRRGLCGIFGQHWGGPEGDAFGRAAHRLEELGIDGLLINCIPPDHVEGILPYLRDFTDLPLGVYPNLGYFTDAGWRFESSVDGAQYAELAVRWRNEGAQIVGGCCGVRPEHIAAARDALDGRPRGRPRPVLENGSGEAGNRRHPPWKDARERPLYPLGFPELSVDTGIHGPDEASFMVWRYLFSKGIGAHQRCLDVGCGSGIMGIQLALNSASHVHAIDIDPRAVANTRTNAFRNGVDDRLSAATVDIYPWLPEERYEVIVASLHQRPVDPLEASSSHRMVDYWGRTLVDQLLAKLPQALAREGTAYVLQLSILSQQQTDHLLDTTGFASRVVDYTLFRFTDEYERATEQIAHIEELSDAHHLDIGGERVMVAYLLEVRAQSRGEESKVATEPRRDRSLEA